MIKVLHVLSAVNGGGIESLLLNYYRLMDKSKISFDFVAHKEHGRMLEEEFKGLGSNVFYITSQRDNLRQNQKELKEILVNHTYDIVHFHHGILSLGVSVVKKYAPKAKIIVHSHATTDNSKSIRLIKPILKKYLIKKTDYHCACGIAAAQYLWGTQLVEQGKVKIINNAINLERFAYNAECNKEIREEFGVAENCFLIGTIGRFTLQKNPFFIVELLEKIRGKGVAFKFLWVGGGELKEKIQQEIQKRNLQDYIIFAGVRKDVYKFYSALDLFILPSIFEGLPVVGIESQCNGVSVLMSDKISSETKIAGNCNFLPLDEEIWCNEIVRLSKTIVGRQNNIEKIRNAGYDIALEADKLTAFYEDIFSKKV